MLTEQAKTELNRMIESAYNEGLKAGLKQARAERTKELNALAKKLEDVEKQIDRYAEQLLDLSDDIRNLAGHNARYRSYD